jgi:hypothetical protein
LKSESDTAKGHPISVAVSTTKDAMAAECHPARMRFFLSCISCFLFVWLRRGFLLLLAVLPGEIDCFAAAWKELPAKTSHPKSRNRSLSPTHRLHWSSPGQTLPFPSIVLFFLPCSNFFTLLSG